MNGGNESTATEREAVAHQRSCSPLVWTRETPKESGFYWYREHVQHRAEICDVAIFSSGGFAEKWGCGVTQIEGNFNGWWAGPIPKPVAPPCPANDKLTHGATP